MKGLTKQSIVKFISCLGIFVALISASSSCIAGFLYEPKMPESLIKKD